MPSIFSQNQHHFHNIMSVAQAENNKFLYQRKVWQQSWNWRNCWKNESPSTSFPSSSDFSKTLCSKTWQVLPIIRVRLLLGTSGEGIKNIQYWSSRWISQLPTFKIEKSLGYSVVFVLGKAHASVSIILTLFLMVNVLYSYEKLR